MIPLASAPLPESADSILHDVFGYSAFRGAQAEIVSHVVDGGDALVLMPTGGGKSLCYQIPAIARHRGGRGVAVVVSPLIALMHDQVGALEEAGVHAAFLNSSQTGEEATRIEREMMSGRLTLLYAAPRAVPRNGGDLVAQALAAAGGHQHQRVAAGDHLVDDGGLRAAELLVAEDFVEDGLG